MPFSMILSRSARRCRSVLLWAVAIGATSFTLTPSLSHAVATDAPLGFEEALRLAEQDAPMIAAQEAAVEASSRRVGPAGELPDPELVLGLENLPAGGVDAWNWNRDEMTMRRIGVMQALPRREKRDLRVQRAEADAAREQALLASARLSTREAVAAAWIAAAMADRRLALVTDLRAQTDVLVGAAAAAIGAGRGSTADAVAARQAKAELEDRIAMMQLARDQSRIALSQWLPDDAMRPLDAAPDWHRIPLSVSSALDRIDAHRDLMAYEASTRAARSEIALAKAEKRPDWSVQLAFSDRGPSLPNMVSLEFSVGLPIFSRQRKDPLIAASEAALLQLESEREAARRQYRVELQKQESIWRNTKDRAERYEQELLPLTDERVRAALAAYRGGAGGLQDVVAGLDAAIAQRLAYIDVLETLGQSWASLTFAFPEER